MVFIDFEVHTIYMLKCLVFFIYEKPEFTKSITDPYFRAKAPLGLGAIPALKMRVSFSTGLRVGGGRVRKRPD